MVVLQRKRNKRTRTRLPRRYGLSNRGVYPSLPRGYYPLNPYETGRYVPAGVKRSMPWNRGRHTKSRALDRWHSRKRR